MLHLLCIGLYDVQRLSGNSCNGAWEESAWMKSRFCVGGVFWQMTECGSVHTQDVQTDSWAHPGVKRLALEVEHVLPSTAEFRNEWSNISTHGADRNNSAFTLRASYMTKTNRIKSLMSTLARNTYLKTAHTWVSSFRRNYSFAGTHRGFPFNPLNFHSNVYQNNSQLISLEITDVLILDAFACEDY